MALSCVKEVTNILIKPLILRMACTGLLALLLVFIYLTHHVNTLWFFSNRHKITNLLAKYINYVLLLLVEGAAFLMLS